MPTLEEFAVTTEYPQQDEQTPVDASDTVSLQEFMGTARVEEDARLTPGDFFKPLMSQAEIEQLPPVVRSLSVAMADFTSGLFRTPATIAAIAYTPQNLVERYTGWKVGVKSSELPIFKGHEELASLYD